MAKVPTLFTLIASDIGLTFQTSTLPDGYSISKSANWEGNSILNRSSPVVNYSDSSSMEVSVAFQLFATRAGSDPGANVTAASRAFLALEYPVQPGVKPPPTCIITLGNGAILKDWYCVCNSVSLTPKGPWTVDGEAMVCDVSLSFMEVDPKNTDAKTWASAPPTGLGQIVPFGGL